MDRILDKLGTYQIFANLLPGTFFCLILRYFLLIEIPLGDNIGEELLIFYFVGFFIGRLGSLLEKPLTRFEYGRVDYETFLKAEKDDAKLNAMFDMSNFIRSMLVCVILTFIIFVVQKLPVDWAKYSDVLTGTTFPMLIALLLYAYRRQSKFVFKRLKNNTKEL